MGGILHVLCLVLAVGIDLFAMFAAGILNDNQGVNIVLEEETAGPHNTKEKTETVLGHSAGELLFDEFRLIRHLPAMSDSFAEVEQGAQAKPPLEFPYANNLPQYLGTGSFGISWLVKGEQRNTAWYGKFIVMKLLYVKSKRGKALRHLTWDEAMHNPTLKSKVMESLIEFHNCLQIEQAALTLKHIGGQRVMKCLDHNIRRDSGDDPLYLLLEHSGDYELNQFLRKKENDGKLNLPLLQSVTKQLFEGLSFLTDARWIHHDLKPENIVIRETGGVVYLKIIDLGAAVHVSQGNLFKTAATKLFAPHEFLRHNFKICDGGANDLCPFAFDIFSAGMTVFEMWCGQLLVDVFQQIGGFYQNEKYEEYFNALDRLAKHQGLFKTMQKSTVCERWRLLSGIAEDTQFADVAFKATLRRTIYKEAEDRPTVHEILNSPWLKDVATPTDSESTVPGVMKADQIQPRLLEEAEEERRQLSIITVEELQFADEDPRAAIEQVDAKLPQQVGAKLAAKKTNGCPEEFHMCTKCKTATGVKGNQLKSNGRPQVLCFALAGQQPLNYNCIERIPRRGYYVFMCAEPEKE